MARHGWTVVAGGQTGTVPSRRVVLALPRPGYAYAIDSSELQRLRAEIAGRWSGDLIRQDAQGFCAHITIQNKTDAATAKAFFGERSITFVPFEAMATGLLLWRYRGGPWEFAGEHRFTG